MFLHIRIEKIIENKGPRIGAPPRHVSFRNGTCHTLGINFTLPGVTFPVFSGASNTFHDRLPGVKANSGQLSASLLRMRSSRPISVPMFAGILQHLPQVVLVTHRNGFWGCRYNLTSRKGWRQQSRLGIPAIGIYHDWWNVRFGDKVNCNISAGSENQT